MLFFALTLALAAAGRVRFDSVDKLAFERAPAVAHRGPRVQQMQCIDGCSLDWKVPSAECFRVGGSGADTEWRCQTPAAAVELADYRVTCVPWAGAGDEYIAEGSCSLTYALRPAPQAAHDGGARCTLEGGCVDPHPKDFHCTHTRCAGKMPRYEEAAAPRDGDLFSSGDSDVADSPPSPPQFPACMRGNTWAVRPDLSDSEAEELRKGAPPPRQPKGTDGAEGVFVVAAEGAYRTLLLFCAMLAGMAGCLYLKDRARPVRYHRCCPDHRKASNTHCPSCRYIITRGDDFVYAERKGTAWGWYTPELSRRIVGTVVHIEPGIPYPPHGKTAAAGAQWWVDPAEATPKPAEEPASPAADE